MLRQLGLDNEGFRARKGAAPLKPDRQKRIRHRLEKFPRPQGRGPIEAHDQQAVLGVSGKRFRARKGAAPLKQSLAFWARHRKAWFPRPQGRGPIEAQTSMSNEELDNVVSAPARARPH